MSSFSESLIAWFQLNARELPWRQTRDPYRIWISEVILQQTRVVQGTAYYHRFLERFPNLSDLALAAANKFRSNSRRKCRAIKSAQRGKT
jgi:A/G-specific adenine glycosylase